MRKYSFGMMFVLIVFAFSGCSSGPSKDMLMKVVAKRYSLNSSSQFQLTSIQKVKEEKKTVTFQQYKVDGIHYVLDATLTAKSDCYMKHPETKTLKVVPPCLTDAEISKAKAGAKVDIDHPLRSIASAMIVGESKRVDHVHPVKKGDEYTLKGISVYCKYEHFGDMANKWQCKE